MKRYVIEEIESEDGKSCAHCMFSKDNKDNKECSIIVINDLDCGASSYFKLIKTEEIKNETK